VRGAVHEAARPVELRIGGDAVALLPVELERLLQALAALEDHDATCIAEDIVAMRLAGGVIQLFPTEAELAALRRALVADEERELLGLALLRLARICDRGRVAEPVR
jgi:hypothetical protein